MRRKLTFFCLVGILICLISFPIHAQPADSLKAIDLVKLTFDDLMRVEIKSASLTGLERIKTPGSVTTISKEEIQLTPYRTL